MTDQREHQHEWVKSVPCRHGDYKRVCGCGRSELVDKDDVIIEVYDRRKSEQRAGQPAMDAIIPKPPDFIFDRPRGERVLGEETYSYMLARNEDGSLKIDILPNKGIFNYYVGVKHPTKGFVTPEAMFALNSVKRLFAEGVFLARDPFFMLWAFFRKKSLMEAFNRVFYKMAGHQTIKSVYLSQPANAFEEFIFRMTGNKDFAHNVAQYIEYDDAYRYRAQDICTELNEEAFRENPRAEVRRLIALYGEREKNQSVAKKLNDFARLATVLLLIPSVKKKVVGNVDVLKGMQFDEADRFWVAFTDNGYDYFGLPIDERMKAHEERPYAIKIKV